MDMFIVQLVPSIWVLQSSLNQIYYLFCFNQSLFLERWIYQVILAKVEAAVILLVQFPEKSESRSQDAALCERWREITKQLSRWQLRRPRPLCIPITPHPLRHQGRLSNCPVHVENLFAAILAVRL